MRHYEIVFMVHPDQSEQVPAMIDRYRELVRQDDGVIHRLEDWGRRPLSYQIGKLGKAHYVLMNIEVTQPTLTELERIFRYNDAVLRHLVLRRDEPHTDESPVMRKKRIDDDRDAARAQRWAQQQAQQAQQAKESVEESSDKPILAEDTVAATATEAESGEANTSPQSPPAANDSGDGGNGNGNSTPTDEAPPIVRDNSNEEAPS